MTDHEPNLIACMVLDPTVCDRLADKLHPSEFADRDLGRLYDTLLALYDARRPIRDLKLLLPELASCGLPQSLTAASWWITLLADPPLASNAAYYAAEIQAADRRRRLLSVALRINADVTAGTEPERTAEYVEAQLASLGSSHEQHPPQRIGQVIAEVCRDLTAEDRPTGPGVMSGILSLDEVTGGWHPGDLAILAARPGVGKTSLATQIALYQATRGRLAGIVSLEMRQTELVMRLVSTWLSIDIRALRSRDLDARAKAKLLELGAEYADSDMPLDLWSPPTASLAGIRGYAKRLSLQGKLSLLVVDYLQLVRPRDYRTPREQQVAEVSRGLKALAKELEVPVLCLAQLNRDVEKTNRAPKLSDLRESGSIEQDADAVVFIHPDKDAHQLIVAKQRFGGIGSVTVHFDAKRTTFTDPPVTTYGNYDRGLAAYANDDF